MPMWLAPIIGWLTHNLARFLGVFAIGVLLIGGPMVLYHNIKVKAYNEGYRAGYSQATKDHPQVVGDNATVVTGQREPFFVLLKIGKFRLLGV